MADHFAPAPSTQHPSWQDCYDHPDYSNIYIEDVHTTLDAFGRGAEQSQYSYNPAHLLYDEGLTDNYLAAQPVNAPLAFSTPPLASSTYETVAHDPLRSNGTDPFLNGPGNYADTPYTSSYPYTTESSWNMQASSYDPLLATAPSRSSLPSTLNPDATSGAGQSYFSPLADVLSYSPPGLTSCSEGTDMTSASAPSPPEAIAMQLCARDPHSIAGSAYGAPLVPLPPLTMRGHVAQEVLSSPDAIAPPSPSETSALPLNVSQKRSSNPRRNTPASPTSSSSTSESGSKWSCPHCPYVQQPPRAQGPGQRVPRMQELKRHIETKHERPEDKSKALWICCGVPLAQAVERKVPLALAQSSPFEYNGMLFVGGCREDFSRPDALARHLRNHEGVCFGDRYGEYLLGNAKKAQRRSS